MSALALALVLTAAVLHATWNLSANRAAGGDGVAFVLLMSVASTAFLLPGVGRGALTGLWIAAYTVVDVLVSSLFLAPFALRDPASVRREWLESRWQIVVVGVLSPVAYTLVLFALRLAPLAYVAPLREVSMMIGVLYGVWLLHERVTVMRLAGVVAFAFA